MSEIELDQLLIQRTNAGDQDAFDEIIARYQAKIFGLALGLLRNRSDAEEVTQDVFIRAYKGLTNFRGESSLATWLYRIAMNLARNRYWHNFRRRRHATLSLDCPLGEDSSATLADQLAGDQCDPAQKCSWDEFTRLLSAALDRLEASHREILTMRTAQHLSYDDIATILRIRVGTVKSRLARAREQLRAQLNLECPEFAPDAPSTDYFLPQHAHCGIWGSG